MTIEDRVKKELKDLPINCKICGDRLTMMASGPDTVWACTDLIDYNGVNGCRRSKEGRSLVDKHYMDSERYITFEKWNTYELVEAMLRRILSP